MLRLFVTTLDFTGDFGGQPQADDLCTTAARAAEKGGTWKAWVSSSFETAYSRMADAGPWSQEQADGGRVRTFANKAGLLSTQLARIALDEHGRSAAARFFWTGTSDGGTGLGPSCNQWTVMSSGGGIYGTGDPGPSWSHYSILSCGLRSSLLCFEQDTVPLPPPEGSVKRIFVTSQQFAGSFGGLSQADVHCTNAAADGGMTGVWKAWLSTSTVSALSRISDAGTWYQESTDAGLLRTFNNRCNLATAPLVAVRYDEHGQAQSTTDFWTGTHSGGAGTVSTCQNWTSALSTEFGTEGRGAGNYWTEYTAQFCNRQASLLCLEQ